MNEFFKQKYTKEEEFIKLFPEVVSNASIFLGEEWHPDPKCTDGIRKDRNYFFSNGELKQLVFDSASIYHRNNSLSSAKIVLRSSNKIVTVKVVLDDGTLIAEKAGYKKLSPPS